MVDMTQSRELTEHDEGQQCWIIKRRSVLVLALLRGACSVTWTAGAR